MGNTSMKSPSAKEKYFTVLRKEAKTNYTYLLVIVIWMLMIFCGIKKSIQSILSEMENAIFIERLNKRMYQIQYLSLPPKVLFIKTNTVQNTDFSYTNLGVWAWTIASEKQITVKSCVKKKNHQLIEVHDYFRPKPTVIFAYPSSIRTYVEDLLRTPHASQLDLMRHEWARYRTYESFPKTCNVSPIKLSRAGFYFTGIQDQTICFSCGFKYKNWFSEDSPLEIHRQMSPDCAFMKGSDDRNVAIERDNDGIERHQQHNYEIVHHENGASGGANELNQSAQYQYGSRQNHAERTARDSKEAQTNELNEGISLNDVNSVGSKESSGPQYISIDRATHPHYATLSSRLTSFTGWLGRTTHEPRDLASAGFFYVGTGDSVRCFFCGGGLRNWQNEDDPYAEHARWYPECSYIQIYRGDEQAQVYSRNNESSPATFEAQSVGNVPFTEQKDLEQNPLRTIAAQCILSMGYKIQTVKQAIEMLRINQAEGTNFTAEQLLEIILEKEENQSNNDNSVVGERVKDSCQKHTDTSSLENINKGESTNTRIEIQDSSDTIRILNPY